MVNAKWLMMIVFFCFAKDARTQSIEKDSLPLQQQNEKNWLKKRFNDKEASPQKATIFSLALPGAGQVYNKKWWKVPIVYAGLGTGVYLIDRNTTQYKRFRNALILEEAGETHEFSNTNLNEADMRRIRNVYRKDVERSYILTIFLYLLNGVDAFVDAHMSGFNVSEDLSLDLYYQTNSQYNGLNKAESIPTLSFKYTLR